MRGFHFSQNQQLRAMESTGCILCSWTDQSFKTTKKY